MKNQQNITTTSQTAAPMSSPEGLMGALSPIILMVLVFYFLIIRPQQKREAKSRELVNSIKKGDKIVTTSGIIGVVHKIVSDKELSLEIAENVRIRMVKNSVTQVLENNATLEEKKTDEKSALKHNVINQKSGTKRDNSRSKK
ncbi:MAG: preprotein translocase subunit YajC [Holosporaceae bacterium]|jgi:preprotein translocase subunit YajC|nr:preprotein translocase subunit YajC [Holosporaceae bacterium]